MLISEEEKRGKDRLAGAARPGEGRRRWGIPDNQEESGMKGARVG